MTLYGIPIINPSINKPSLPSPTFIDPETAKEFDCGICLQTLTDPVDIGCINGHVYCSACITILISQHTNQNQFTCPSCRSTCTIQSIRQMPFIQRQIKRLRIKCPNFQITPQLSTLLSQKNEKNEKNQNKNNRKSRSCITVPHRSRSRSRSRSRERNDTTNAIETTDPKSENDSNETDSKKQIYCEWTGTISDLDAHLLRCEYQIISCEYCTLSCIRKDLTKHYLQCSSYPIKCKLCNELVRRSSCSLHLEFNCPKAETECICGAKLLREAQPMHSERDCPEYKMRCEYHIHGCLNMIKRKDMQKHMKENMSVHLSLVTHRCNYLTNCVDNLNARMQHIEQRFNLNYQQ